MNREELLQQLEEKIRFIYGSDYKPEYVEQIESLLKKWEGQDWPEAEKPSEETVYLITYGDSIYEEGKPTLETLHGFLKEKAKGIISDVHLLPMFPYTSDDGFSVTDYREINPKLGDWSEIEGMSKDFRLMFDFVANHISQSSRWFQGYLQEDPNYKEYFVPHDPDFDASQVVRPRTSPLFHEYEGKNGTKTAWTTFSKDQVDVNVAHFPVLVDLTDILLMYAHRGGTSIRLDAIGFLWKESGTSCIHLPQTHAIIQMWNLILEYFKPNTQIITETNVPHKENISYFGDGKNEANMVYQFSLPPLVLHALTTHNGKTLTEWAKTIGKVSDKATYFNFLASHDGIGMRPTEGILSEDEKQMLVDKVVENGGKVSYKSNPDGTQSVYELNINYADALVNKDEDVSEEQQIQKTLAAHSILLSVIGVPAIYYHSLFGSRNDYEGLEASGINRRINREKLEVNQLKDELETSPRRSQIFNKMSEMIQVRKKEKAFSPYAEQEVLDLGEEVFALKRTGDGDSVYFVVNLNNEETTLDAGVRGTDLLSGETVDGSLKLGAYEFVWIKE
ncbi:alpha-amylase family glycosyl hydrolase [Bacillus sp. Marseille-Q3570]|uniref:alpha-amylase family glycosyl hydrolase n=1 Tax=Bacillus sp. Marseille-Q3570 TaxID=2963522 RepID=UPI0021B70750|nr:alpha-amylase family glycosyl hydrolase [Bacillus sp. Marseille-Q3570]